jgi:hypothetical protein
VVDTPGESVTQFRVIELGQDAPAERLIVDVAQGVDCLGNPADFGECFAKVVGLSRTCRVCMIPAAL